MPVTPASRETAQVAGRCRPQGGTILKHSRALKRELPGGQEEGLLRLHLVQLLFLFCPTPLVLHSVDPKGIT